MTTDEKTLNMLYDKDGALLETLSNYVQLCKENTDTAQNEEMFNSSDTDYDSDSEEETDSLLQGTVEIVAHK